MRIAMRLARGCTRRCVWFVLAAAACPISLHAQTPRSPAASAPDFALAAAPNALSVTAGAGAQTVSVSAIQIDGFSGTIQVTISNLPSGVTATPASFALQAGNRQSVSLLASPAATGEHGVLFTGVSGNLKHAVQVAVTVKADVLMHHNNIGRTGLNPSEVTLTHQNVNSAQFGLLRMLPADGVVDAEPLLVSNISAGGTVRDLVYVVTEHDSVYAYDAATGAQVWMKSVLAAGETTSNNHGCSQITPEIGTTATPVIDRGYGAHGAIFLVAMTEDMSGAFHHRLHALDLATGVELPHSPVEVTATYPGTGANSSNGKVVFDPQRYAERAGLLLMNGSIFMAFTSHCDGNPYTGWLMSYSESSLTQTSVLNVTPNGSEGAIWMAGSGLAADSSGFIYFLDGNGTFDTTLTPAGFPVHGDFGNGFIKASTASGKLAVADYFEMSNTVSESNNDLDLGSGGAMVLPDVTDRNGGVHHLAVGAGKDGNIYVVNRDSMGKFNPSNDSAIYQELAGQLPYGVWAMPAYYNNMVYYAGNSDYMKLYPIVNGKLETTPSAKSLYPFQYPGATPSVSANGTDNGIVWAVRNSSPAILFALRAYDLNLLYSSNQAANNRDNFGNGNKFITPMVANGRVYVGTADGVAVFGLLP